MNTVTQKRKIVDVEVDGIDRRDAPDYVDAFIASATWDDTGEALNEAELEELNEDGDFVYNAVMDRLY